MRPDANKLLLQRLTAARKQLAVALEQQDWERIAVIDKSIAECLRKLAEQEPLSPELLNAKRQLQKLHSRAMTACADACEELRQVLQAHREHSEGRTAYLHVDLLQDEK